MNTGLAAVGVLIIGIGAVVTAVSKRQRRALDTGAKILTIPVVGIVIGTAVVVLAFVGK
jgi:hypothetical protein